jgi:hypothetical protein
VVAVRWYFALRTVLPRRRGAAGRTRRRSRQQLAMSPSTRQRDRVRPWSAQGAATVHSRTQTDGVRALHLSRTRVRTKPAPRALCDRRRPADTRPSPPCLRRAGPLPLTTAANRRQAGPGTLDLQQRNSAAPIRGPCAVDRLFEAGCVPSKWLPPGSSPYVDQRPCCTKDILRAPGRTRTCDLPLRRRQLYPLSYGGSSGRLPPSEPAQADVPVRR